jgi:hypothetical protein
MSWAPTSADAREGSEVRSQSPPKGDPAGGGDGIALRIRGSTIKTALWTIGFGIVVVALILLFLKLMTDLL